MKKPTAISNTYYNAFFSACEKNQTDIMLRYLQKGIDVNYQKKSRESAIMVALKNNQVEALEVLLNNGAIIPEFATTEVDKAKPFIVSIFQYGDNIKVFDALYNHSSQSHAFKDEHILVLIQVSIYFKKPALLTSCLHKIKDSDVYLMKVFDELKANHIIFSSLEQNKHGLSDYYKQMADSFLDFILEKRIPSSFNDIYQKLIPLVSNPEQMIASLEKEKLEVMINSNEMPIKKLKL